MKLIDGYGQIGTALKSMNSVADVSIYHKWNFLNKVKRVQRNCVCEFIEYVDDHPEEKIVFISTATANKTPYLEAKRFAENHLLKNTDNGIVIKLPCIIGKGVCQKFKEKAILPYGAIELITIAGAVNAILDNLNGSRIVQVKGDLIKAQTVYDLIHFGGRDEGI